MPSPRGWPILEPQFACLLELAGLTYFYCISSEEEALFPLFSLVPALVQSPVLEILELVFGRRGGFGQGFRWQLWIG